MEQFLMNWLYKLPDTVLAHTHKGSFSLPFGKKKPAHVFEENSVTLVKGKPDDLNAFLIFNNLMFFHETQAFSQQKNIPLSDLLKYRKRFFQLVMMNPRNRLNFLKSISAGEEILGSLALFDLRVVIPATDINFSEALISNVAVHPTLQGRGLGEALVRNAFESAKKLHYKTLYLTTNNPKARALYEKLGFTLMDLNDPHLWNIYILLNDSVREESWFMVKKI